MVSAWNPGQLKDMLLPPCHYSFQLWTKELTADEREEIYHGSGKPIKLVAHIKNESTDVQNDKVVNRHIHEFLDKEGIPRRSLSLMFHMRSVDCFLGLPFDVASYATLLHIFSHFCGMQPEELVMTSGDTHVYTNHLEQVQVQKLRASSAYKLPKFELSTAAGDIYGVTYEELSAALKNYQCHPAIKAEVAV
jgi:thymidylate synthase